MTFEEWWKSRPITESHFDRDKLSAGKAWAEATRIERERCAKICDTHRIDDLLVGVGIAESCAVMIREQTEGATK